MALSTNQEVTVKGLKGKVGPGRPQDHSLPEGYYFVQFEDGSQRWITEAETHAPAKKKAKPAPEPVAEKVETEEAKVTEEKSEAPKKRGRKPGSTKKSKKS